jgi:hypothetical protein
MGHVKEKTAIMARQAQEYLGTARRLTAQAARNGYTFVNLEIEVSRAFAKRAWALCATGHMAAAKLQAIAAITAYQTAKNVLPDLSIKRKYREQLSVKLGTITPLIERLATIT